MNHASQQRFSIVGDEAKKDAIIASEEWLEELKNLPFKSCKLLFADLLTFLPSEPIHYYRKKWQDSLLAQAEDKAIIRN